MLYLQYSRGRILCHCICILLILVFTVLSLLFSRSVFSFSFVRVSEIDCSSGNCVSYLKGPLPLPLLLCHATDKSCVHHFLSSSQALALKQDLCVYEVFCQSLHSIAVRICHCTFHILLRPQQLQARKTVFAVKRGGKTRRVMSILCRSTHGRTRAVAAMLRSSLKGAEKDVGGTALGRARDREMLLCVSECVRVGLQYPPQQIRLLDIN